MLSTIRGKAKSWVVKILFAFLILAFAAWGIGDIFARRDLSDPVLKVGDLQYSPTEFSQDLQRRLQTFQEQGLTINAQQFAALGGIEQILSRATNRLLLEQYADTLGLTIPQNVAIADIQTNPSFQGAGGAFDRDRFLAVLRQNAFSEAGYVALVQEELRRQQLLGPTFANVVAPKALVDGVLAYLEETRGAELLVIPDASMTGITDPDQAALEKSYQENIGSYQRPEYRAIVVLHLTPQDFTKDANIAEDQLKAEFEARQAEFATVETRSVEQVVVQDQEAADAIVAAANSGKSFADAVQEATGGAPIDLGDVAKDAMPADIAEQTFALAADATSAPLKSAFGWHVVHVKSVTPATAKSFDEVREQLRGDLALAQAGDAMASAVNQLDDILASGASVEDAATQMGFTARKIDAVDASGQDRDGKDLGLSPEILQLAQQTEAGGTSLVSTLGDGSYAVVQVTGVAPAEPKPLAEVTDQVKADWLERARRDAADAKARELAEQLKTSGDLAALGQELGLSLKVAAPFKRDKGDPDNGIDPTMAQALFGVKLGEPVTGRGADGAIVARLSAIEPAKPEDAKEQRDELAKQLAATLRNDLSAEFSAALGREITIERNDDVINQMLATEQWLGNDGRAMNVEPAFEAFAATYESGKPQVIWTRLIADLETPVSALMKLADGQPNSFLLESVEGGRSRGRYSLIGLKPDLIWRCRGDHAEINRNARFQPDSFEPEAKGALASLRALIAESRIDLPATLPPMASGLFGYMAYDMIRLVETLPDTSPDNLKLPDSIFLRPTVMAIFDSVEDMITVVTPVWPSSRGANAGNARAAYNQALERLSDIVSDLDRSLPQQRSNNGVLLDLPEPKSNMTPEAFRAMVDRAKEYILAGDIFQVVLSQRFSLPFQLPPLALYRSLRRLNPSPFLFYLDFGGFSVIGSSPEILVRLRDDVVTIRPIAGTRPRGKNPDEDRALAEDLLADQKELAEHLMLLDLGRNDVGRVAKIGSVKVTEKNKIELYSHVMHIVSNVEGTIDPKYDAMDALMAGFPAGTVSGAPKVRAMEIIEELEPEKRGIYGGAVGYFAANGGMDTCIALRTTVVKDGVMHVQAGAGIVADSVAESEHQECQHKARALVRAAQEAVRFAAAGRGNS